MRLEAQKRYGETDSVDIHVDILWHVLMHTTCRVGADRLCGVYPCEWIQGDILPGRGVKGILAHTMRYPHQWWASAVIANKTDKSFSPPPPRRQYLRGFGNDRSESFVGRVDAIVIARAMNELAR